MRSSGGVAGGPQPRPEWFNDLVAGQDSTATTPRFGQVYQREWPTVAPWSSDTRTPQYFVDCCAVPSGGLHVGSVESQVESVAAFMYPACSGPPGSCHGGAIASAIDSVLGFTALHNGIGGFTLNLTVTYRAPLPLETGPGVTVRITSRIQRIEGVKAFLSAEVTNDDRSNVYATATAIWYIAGKREEQKDGVPVKAPSHANILSELLLRLEHIEEEGPPAYRTPVKLDAAVATTTMEQCPLYHGSMPYQVLGPYVNDNPKLDVIARINTVAGGLTGIVAFSRETMGPPGFVHGGCVFSVLDAAAAAYVFGTTEKGGVMLTSKLSVDFQKVSATWRVRRKLPTNKQASAVRQTSAT